MNLNVKSIDWNIRLESWSPCAHDLKIKSLILGGDLVNMTNEQQELLNSFQEEIEKCFDIAQKLDDLNPELPRAFTGTPSLRIERQLYALGILND